MWRPVSLDAQARGASNDAIRTIEGAVEDGEDQRAVVSLKTSSGTAVGLAFLLSFTAPEMHTDAWDLLIDGWYSMSYNRCMLVDFAG